MTNKPKQKGTRAESDVRAWLRYNGFPNARRNVLEGVLDPGDIDPIPVDPPPIVVSVKSGYGPDVHPQTTLFYKWWQELDATCNRRNPQALRMLAHKRAGKSDPAFWHWYTGGAYVVRYMGPDALHYHLNIVKITGSQALFLMREWAKT